MRVVLKKGEIDKFPKLTFDELKKEIDTVSDDETCPICLMELKPSEENEEIVEGVTNQEDETLCTYLPCKHYFHYHCIKRDLEEYHHICPICRNNVGEHEMKKE